MFFYNFRDARIWDYRERKYKLCRRSHSVEKPSGSCSESFPKQNVLKTIYVLFLIGYRPSNQTKIVRQFYLLKTRWYAFLCPSFQ